MAPKKRQPLTCMENKMSLPREPEEYVSYNNPEFQHLICFICEGVFEDPVQCQDQHYFCRTCIQEWLLINPSCPIDVKPLTKSDLKAAPRILKNIIDDLHVKCQYHVFGCPVTIHGGSPSIPSSSVTDHTSTCIYRWWSLIDHDYNLTFAKDKSAQETGFGETAAQPQDETITILD